MAAVKKKSWFSKRTLLTIAVFVAGVAELERGHLTAEAFVYLMAICIAGHHAPDLIKAWRGTN